MPVSPPRQRARPSSIDSCGMRHGDAYMTNEKARDGPGRRTTQWLLRRAGAGRFEEPPGQASRQPRLGKSWRLRRLHRMTCRTYCRVYSTAQPCRIQAPLANQAPSHTFQCGKPCPSGSLASLIECLPRTASGLVAKPAASSTSYDGPTSTPRPRTCEANLRG